MHYEVMEKTCETLMIRDELIEKIRNKIREDIDTWTAISEVTGLDRQVVKSWGHAFAYGAGMR